MLPETKFIGKKIYENNDIQTLLYRKMINCKSFIHKTKVPCIYL